MTRRMTLRDTLVALFVGLVMLVVCAVGVRSINQLQGNLTNVLNQNAASLRAAQDLEIKLRQLRFHVLTYVVDATPERAALIQGDHQGFEDALGRARVAATTSQERELIDVIADGYRGYRVDLERADRPPLERSRDLVRWIDTHPIRKLVAPCQELLQLSQDQMELTARESERVSAQARSITLGLAILGPLAGLISGFGVARGLSRSVAWLNVWVRDVQTRLDEQAGAIQVTTEPDVGQLDEQVRQVVDRVQDMVDRLQRQQQQILRAEQLAAVGQLAAGMAHEIRNPLTTIKLLIGVALREDRPDALSNHDLAVIHEEIVRLERTVQGLLDFARLPQARRQVSDLDSTIEHALDLIRPRAAQQGVRVEFRKPGEPVSASLDPDQMHTTLVNLFLNALDAMPQGGLLEVERRPGAGGVEVVVRDTGNGIPPTVAERLFTPFVTSKPTGTGLGLSTCRRIVEGHGGRITAHNEPAGGTRFVIQLPLHEEDPGDGTAVADR